ncbi:MAG: CpsD/CapB family tyrosine-protein kinase [Rickettsiales bacterium]|nr:CpsD/CapB family tyrosine-protein kinase [Rickettsiales bacterium]
MIELTPTLEQAHSSDDIAVPVHYVGTDPLFNASIARGVRSLCISASAAGEGVSTVAYSMAKRSAAAGKRTLLVDANLRHPCVGERLGVIETPWNGELSTLDDAIHHFEKINLSILNGLNHPIAPVHLRDPNGIKAWVQQLLEQFEIVIFDCEPLGVPGYQGIPADALAAGCDGCALVVQAAHTPQEQLIQAMAHLNSAQAALLGCVLNRQYYPGLSVEIEQATNSSRNPAFMEALWTRLITKLQHIEAML